MMLTYLTRYLGERLRFLEQQVYICHAVVYSGPAICAMHRQQALKQSIWGISSAG